MRSIILLNCGGIIDLMDHLQTRLATLRPDAKRAALLALLAAVAFRLLRPSVARRLTSSRAVSLATRAAIPAGLALWALHRRRTLFQAVTR